MSQEEAISLDTIRQELASIKQDLSVLHEQGKTLIGNQQVLQNDIRSGVFYKNAQTLLSEAHHISMVQSCEFIAKNMYNARIFSDRMDLLRKALQATDGDGLYLEFGVFQGESINIIAKEMPLKTIYGFDSFEGLPEEWTAGTEKGTFNVGGNLPTVENNVHLVKGWFDATLPQFLDEHKEPCNFIHVDCDLYSSTKTVFNLLKERIVPGTQIVFDEYFNYIGWQEGEHKAFQEFIEETHLHFKYIGYSTMQVGVSIVE